MILECELALIGNGKITIIPRIILTELPYTKTKHGTHKVFYDPFIGVRCIKLNCFLNWVPIMFVYIYWDSQTNFC